MQAHAWCQAMCLNPARQRRRHRRAIEDWAHLHQHALNAEAAPGTRQGLAALGWRPLRPDLGIVSPFSWV